jgi:hypothetical protein
VAICAGRAQVPGRDLSALANALGQRAKGAIVLPSDIRWQPSEGLLGDLLQGRSLVFLARAAGEDTRDVWRARARVTPDGAVIDVSDAHDLTNTPLGDDHELVATGWRVAFATRAYGQEQAVTLLDLRGEGALNKSVQSGDRAMAAITNLQRTGSATGIGRVDVTLESPGRAVALALDAGALRITLYGGDPHLPPTVTEARVDLDRGDLESPVAGMHVDASMHLPKRFSHWVVDTLRAVPWIGPAPIAWVEDQALGALDTYHRLTRSSADAKADLATGPAEAAPAPLDTRASTDETQWPPARIAPIWKSPEPGEGVWVVPEVAWLRRPAGASEAALSAFYQTFVRPDEERPYSKVLLVAMDMRQLELDMEAGVEDPEPLTGPAGSGRIPRDPAVYRRVAAAFNGAFKTEHGHYGMMVHKRVLLPPVPGAATILVLSDRRVGFGTWGVDRKLGGMEGIADEDIVSFRQNLDPLIDHGQINPTGRSQWGFTIAGKGVQTERSGVCVTSGGHLVYAWGDDVNAKALALAMKAAGCDYAMHLDMNPYHTGFLFTAIDDLSARRYKSQLLTSGMSIQPDRYIQYSPKDFFYVLARDVRPAPVEGATPWAPDGGTQPPPAWMPGVWSATLTTGKAKVDLLDVEPDRVLWRIRAGAKDAVLASPLRSIAGEDAAHAIFAATMGVAPDRRALGLGTDGRLAVPVRANGDAGVMFVQNGRMGIVGAEDAPPLGVHDDLSELPIVLWDGQPRPGPAGAVAARAALGVTPSGRVVIARGVFADSMALAEALAKVGCSRALALDRGARSGAVLDRAGTQSPPRSGYDESVLYAVASPLPPSGFRFGPGTLVADAKR